jgi:RNA polymerase sigma factor (sigma-70 family)
VCDAHRAHKRHERIHRTLPVPESHSTCPQELVTARQELTSLLRAASALPPRERDVFMLWVADTPLTEIAHSLGVSYKSVESALARAKAKVRASASDEPDTARFQGGTVTASKNK